MRSVRRSEWAKSAHVLRAAALGLVLVAGAAAPHLAPAAGDACEASAKRALLGFVVAVSGTAWLERPGCEPARRALRCGEELREGDHVVTSTGGRLAFLARDVYAQMDSESELRVQLTQEGAADVVLLRGYVRVIDQNENEDGPLHRIATPDAQSFARGNDTEAAILDTNPKTAYSMICEWAKPIVVERIGRFERAVAQPGECAIARPHIALYSMPGRESKVSLADTKQCDLGDVIGKSSDRFDPNSVAAGGELAALSPPPPSTPKPPGCVTGAAQCGPGPNPPIGPPVNPPVGPRAAVVESPPVFRPPPGLPVRPRRTP